VVGDKRIQVTYTVARTAEDTNTGAVPDGGTVDVVLTGTAGVIPIEFTSYGAFKVTLTDVTDRISRKSLTPVVGEIAGAASTGAEFVFNVLKPVTTGPIYRLPNFY
jgi:hypothetical protein